MDNNQIADTLEGAPITLFFDGKPYKVRPLPIGRARAWRRTLVELDSARVKELGAIESEADKFTKMVSDINPDFVLNLVVAYCESAKPANGDGPVTRAVIEEGSLAEVATAFERIVDKEFPITAVTAGQKALLAVWQR